ncbi:MAG: hypothetical protein R3A48_23705 [Polyangiales bacterium]
MEVVILLAFVGLVLVAGMLLLFGHGVHQRSDQHADRLALLPIQEDAPAVEATVASVQEKP